MSRDAIIVDPGLGFAKRAEHSYRRAGAARRAGRARSTDPVGPSRKSFLKAAIGEGAGEREWGTAAAVTASVLLGAHIVRVHGVAEMVDVVRVADLLREARAGILERASYSDR